MRGEREKALPGRAGLEPAAPGRWRGGGEKEGRSARASPRGALWARTDLGRGAAEGAGRSGRRRRSVLARRGGRSGAGRRSVAIGACPSSQGPLPLPEGRGGAPPDPGRRRGTFSPPPLPGLSRPLAGHHGRGGGGGGGGRSRARPGGTRVLPPRGSLPRRSVGAGGRARSALGGAGASAAGLVPQGLR